MIFELKSEQETCELGMKIAHRMLGGEMILLNGDMGAGKTALTKGIAKGLNIESEVGSPTFTLLNIHHGRLTLYHYDLFRLNSVDEAEEAGLMEYFGDRNGICVLEWADKIPLEIAYLKTINIIMEYIDESTRRATIEGIESI